MADHINPPKPQSTTKIKSFSHSLCKSVIFLLFLVSIPLFPSQAPNFINQNFFIKFWDLIHLLFIGLVVCYGLFSSRNVDVEYDVSSNGNNVENDPQSSFVSRIFHVSPIFEDGYENPSEKNVYSSWVYTGDGQVSDFAGEFDGKVSEFDGKVRNFSGEFDGKVRDFGCEYDDKVGEFGKEFDDQVRDLSNEQNENHFVGSENEFPSWNSQYFQGESMVIMNEPNYGFDVKGKPVEVVGYKPLGLPVRSLKSAAESSVGEFQFSNGSEYGSSLNNGGSSSSSRRSSYEPSFGDAGSRNLEGENVESVDLHSQVQWRSRPDRVEIREKVDLDTVSTRPSHFRPFSVDETQFESLKSWSFGSAASVSSPVESVDLHSQVQWRSRSDRVEIREKVDLDTVSTRPSHFRPFSVDETQFESLKSWSFGSAASVSSPVSSVPDSPSGRSSSYSVASDLPSSETEELEKKTSSRASYPPVSQSSLLTTMNGETRLNAFHLRRYSSGSLFQKDPQKGLKRELREYARSRREESSARKEREQVSSRPDTKSATPVKSSGRGKSVRTIRASRYAAELAKEEEMSENYIDEELAKICGKLSAGNTGEGEMKRGHDNHDNMSIGTSKIKLDVELPMPKPTLAKHQKQESFDSVIMSRNEEFKSKEEDNVIMKTKEASESKAPKVQVRPDDAVTEGISEAESDSYEVDRKAGEFIAKFKEQIRLQKVASIERSSRKNSRINNFR